jgi:hypothetical protein
LQLGGAVEHGAVVVLEAGLLDQRRHQITMRGGEDLLLLKPLAVPADVAVGAEVDEDLELEGLAWSPTRRLWYRRAKLLKDRYLCLVEVRRTSAWCGSRERGVDTGRSRS